MALDISESAVYSWLRHIEGYSIVHNNWKLSPLQIDEYANDEMVLQLFESANNKWNEYYGKPLFNSSLKQTLKQAECDAIGIKVEEGFMAVAMAEVACHTEGLMYGNNSKTADKIFAKILLDIMMSYLCFGQSNLKAYFISPVVKPSVINSINERIPAANEALTGTAFAESSIELIFNDDYKQKINDPLKELVSQKKLTSAEDAEDYLRSLMIYDL